MAVDELVDAEVVGSAELCARNLARSRQQFSK